MLKDVTHYTKYNCNTRESDGATVEYGSYARGSWEWRIKFRWGMVVKGCYNGGELKVKQFLAEIADARYYVTHVADGEFKFRTDYVKDYETARKRNTKEQAIEQYIEQQQRQIQEQQKKLALNKVWLDEMVTLAATFKEQTA